MTETESRRLSKLEALGRAPAPGTENPAQKLAQGIRTSRSEGANAPIDTSSRTEALRSIDATYERKKAQVREDEDITFEAQQRRLRELHAKHAHEYASAYSAMMGEIDDEIEKAYRRMHPVEKPGDVAHEMFQQRLERQVISELANGANALELLERALRVDDKEKARVIAREGKGWLEDRTQQRRFSELVEEHLVPSSVKEARAKHSHLLDEKRVIQHGEALRRRARPGL